MPLTQIEIRNAKPGMHADGSGLYLAAKPSGAKSWMYRHQIGGRRREMGLGAVTALSAVEARAAAARRLSAAPKYFAGQSHSWNGCKLRPFSIR